VKSGYAGSTTEPHLDRSGEAASATAAWQVFRPHAGRATASVSLVHCQLVDSATSAPVSGWPAFLVAAGVLSVALIAYLSDRSFRTRDALSKLLEQFESSGFHVLMWRMEQVTRTGGKSSSIERVNIEELKKQITGDQAKAKKHIIEEALGQDWDSPRAGMAELHFFALRMHAWLDRTRFFRKKRTRLLNETFGYQLLSTLLDHRIVACRIEREDKDESYYPTQYGCLDHAYRDLADRLAKAFLKGNTPDEIQDVLRRKWEVTNERLDSLGGTVLPER
jgi:hypothetical protein